VLWYEHILKGFFTTNTPKYSSNLINHFRNESRMTHALVLFYYFNFRDESTQTCENFVQSIMHQLVHLLPDVPRVLIDLYTHHNSGSLRPSTKELTSCLITILSELDRPVLLLGDAFDECREWNQLWDFISAIVKGSCQSLHFLFTSRPEQYIGDSIASLNIPSIDLVTCIGISQDIESFISENVWNSLRFARISTEGKTEVANSLTTRANGM
jgi:hypothetical protein